MSIEIKVPVLPESVADATIATWHVKVGEQVSRDQNLVDIETDKVVLEVVAPEDGHIGEFLFEEGATVLGEQVIAKFIAGAVSGKEVTKAQAEAATPVAETSDESSDALSPSVRRLLAEHNVDASKVKGTGVGGRITKEDAVNAVPSMGTPTGGSRGTERTKLSMLRRKVAERLVSAKNETAMLTTFNEVNMTPINQIRNEYKDAFKAKHGGLGLGFMSFFTKAVTRALQLYPDVNSMMDGDYKIAYDFADISIAVSGPKGLMVPVVRNAELLTFRGIEAEIKRLALRARDGQITVDDMTGGTFTITNGGVFGSMLSTPIINPPQSGILGMHNVVERAIVKNGQIVIAPVMYVALSYDHRIIDGRESVGFLVAVKEALENPVELLMGGNVKKALEL